MAEVSTHSVLFLDELDDVGGVVGEGAGRAGLDVPAQLVIRLALLGRHRENQVDTVLLDLQRWYGCHLTLSKAVCA